MTLPSFSPVADPASVVVLYHANCPDGFGAAFAAWKVYGESAQYVPYNHGDTPVNVTGKHVLMMDCCYHKEDACAVHDAAASFITLDHHVTAQEECGELPFCHFDMDRSGMGLAWDYFHGAQTRPPLVHHVESRDLFRWTDPDSRAFCLKLDTLPRDFATWEQLAAMDAPALARFIEGGRAMTTFAESMIQTFCADAKKAVFMGHRVWVLNVPRPLATDDCGALLAAREDTDFAVLWNSANLVDVKLSLRSANGFDVAAVATALGGGGHKAASGARMTMDAFRDAVRFV